MGLLRATYPIAPHNFLGTDAVKANRIDSLAPEEVVEVLIKNGADVNIVDKKGYTALHYAAKTGNL